MKNPQSALIPMVVAIVVVFIWSETFISTKILIGEGLEPAEIFVCRFALAYLLCWFVSPKRLFAENLSDELVMFFLGVTGGSLYFLTENSALKYSTASNVGILVCSAPLITALMVSLAYKEERMKPLQALGSLIAFAGVVLVVFNGEFVLHLNPLGDILAVGAALTWGFYSLFMKKVSGKYDVRFITRKVFAYGLLSILPYFLFKPFNFDPETYANPVVWGNLVYLGSIASLVCFVMWNWCLLRLGTVKTTNLIYFQPFFTMLLAHLFLGDRITLMAIAGTVILSIGLAIAARKTT